jgi:hypothetical protein
MKPDQKQSLDNMMLGRIGEFITTMDKENLVVIEHWTNKAREQCAGLRDWRARHRQKRPTENLDQRNEEMNCFRMFLMIREVVVFSNWIPEACW